MTHKPGHTFCKTVGELKKALMRLEDHLPVGVSYHRDDGLGSSLVVMADKDHSATHEWVHLDEFDTTDVPEEM